MRVISVVDLVEDLGKKLQPAPAQISLSFLPCSAPSLPKSNQVPRGNSKVFRCQQTYFAAFSIERASEAAVKSPLCCMPLEKTGNVQGGSAGAGVSLWDVGWKNEGGDTSQTDKRACKPAFTRTTGNNYRLGTSNLEHVQ